MSRSSFIQSHAVKGLGLPSQEQNQHKEMTETKTYNKKKPKFSGEYISSAFAGGAINK